MKIAARFTQVVTNRVLTDDRGQDLIEYGVLTAMIGIAGLLALSALSTNMGTVYSSWDAAAQNAWQPCPPQPASCP